jgi:hypothetical protein
MTDTANKIDTGIHYKMHKTERNPKRFATYLN